MTRRSTFPYVAGARHSAGWYDQRGGASRLQPGDRLFVRCHGGPSVSRLEIYPPRIEIDERDGMYVLEDDGPIDEWRYVFVPHVL